MQKTGKRLVILIKRWLMALIAPKPLIGILYIPRFVRHWFRYRKMTSSAKPALLDSYPCLTDWTPFTPFDPHYFFQGAWLARRLMATGPDLHVDIGSSVLTIGVLSAQVDTVFVDYRPIRAGLSGMTAIAGDITNLPFTANSLTSVSCLHVIEHIGLGRYGDPIDPEGSDKAARELQRVLKPGGKLYLSVPVGIDRVCFNAHRVFAPAFVIAMFPALELKEFSFVDDRGVLREALGVDAAAECEYACGMFVLEKKIQA